MDKRSTAAYADAEFGAGNEDLDANVTREEMHLREIQFRGFSRSDRLYEIEAHLIDRKPRDFAPPNGSRPVRAHEPIHDLGLRLVFDEEMVVRGVRTFFRAFPYRECRSGGETLQSLVGLRIGAGWVSEVRKRLPQGDTCAHLREILIPLASAALQAMSEKRLHLRDALDEQGKPVKIDSCYAYGASRELVMQLWPAFHKPNA